MLRSRGFVGSQLTITPFTGFGAPALACCYLGVFYCGAVWKNNRSRVASEIGESFAVLHHCDAALDGILFAALCCQHLVDRAMDKILHTIVRERDV
jgi:hypothetical protein